jgi:hypothetical protein
VGDLFSEAFEAYPQRGRSVTAPDRAAEAWREACRSVAPADLLAAVRRYAESERAGPERAVPKLQTWLRERRYEAWLKPGSGAKGAPSWSGPPELWAAVVARTDDKFALNYLAPSRWVDLPVRGLVPRNGYARDMLAREVDGVLKAFGVQLLAEDAA